MQAERDDPLVDIPIASFREACSNKERLLDICVEDWKAFLPEDERFISLKWLDKIIHTREKQVS